MKHIYYLSLFASTIMGVSISACSSDSSHLRVPAVRPPVQESLPSVLLQGGSVSNALVLRDVDYTRTCQTTVEGDVCIGLTDADRLLCIIKQRLFCGGPTEVLSLLNALDGRMHEIEQRSDGVPDCLNDSPADHTNDLVFPGEQTLPQYFQCRDSNISMAFGKRDNTWYLRNAQGASAFAFSVNEDTDNVDGYMWLPSENASFSMSTGILHITADKSQGIVEFTGGGVGFGFCAIHYRSDTQHIWIQINPDGVGVTCDSNSDDSTDADDYSEICINAADLTAASDLSECDTLKAAATLPLIGRGETTNAAESSTWEAAATPAEGTLNTIDLNDLKTLFDAAAELSGIADFQ